MSDNGSPSINVTRGKRTRRRSSSDKQSSGSSLLPDPMSVVSGVMQRAQELWWAGLGIVSVAEDAGAKVFDALVEEGKSWEQAQRERREQTAKRVEELTEEGTQAVEAVEKRVREEVNEALHRIGVPHRDDINELRNQIDALADRMDQLAEAIDSSSTEA
jgi:poly(hydroxyalkanoate) granule-associated protein